MWTSVERKNNKQQESNKKLAINEELLKEKKRRMRTWNILNVCDSIDVILSVTVILLHALCLNLIYRRKYGRKHMFIASMLLVELIWCVGTLLNYPIYNFERELLHKYQALLAALNISFFGSIFMLTLERFLEVFLHMRYSKCWFSKNKLKLCLGVWLITLFVAIFVLFLSDGGLQLYFDSYRIVSYVSDGLIIVCFIIVYSYLYKKFRKMKLDQQLERRRSQIFQQQTIGEIQCGRVFTDKSTFIFMPFLIVLTHIMFIAVPRFLYKLTEESYSWRFILYRIANISDGLLYIVFEQSLIKSLMQSACYSKICCKRPNICRRTPIQVIVRNENNAVCETMYLWILKLLGDEENVSNFSPLKMPSIDEKIPRKFFYLAEKWMREGCAPACPGIIDLLLIRVSTKETILQG